MDETDTSEKDFPLDVVDEAVDFGVDNRCSACISNVKEHFVGDLQKTNKVIKGYGGSRIHNVWEGTMSIRIADDNGSVETFVIPHSYYVPDGDARLLSPQHWSKYFKASQRPPASVAPEQTFTDKVVLTWNKGDSVKTIPLDDVNVATFNLAPGYSRFDLYCKEIKVDPTTEDAKPDLDLTVQSAALIEDEEATVQASGGGRGTAADGDTGKVASTGTADGGGRRGKFQHETLEQSFRRLRA